MNKGNLNSETGLPLSVFNVNRDHEVGIFEMGMNRVDEIQELSNVLNPNYAIITNIGTAHIGILGSKDIIAEEKKKIFSNFTNKDIGFVPENDCYVDYLTDVQQGTIKTFGIKSMKNISSVESLGMDGTYFLLNKTPVTLHLTGEYNFVNSLGVILLAETLGLSDSEIKAGVEAINPLDGRGLVKGGLYSVVYDCYNANPESMSASIKFYGDLNHKGRKVFVLGDMLELGPVSQIAHEKIGELVGECDIDEVYFIGEQMSYGADFAERMSSIKNNPMVIRSITDSSDRVMEDVAEEILGRLDRGDLILFKGSNGMRLDRIANIISNKEGE